jgi:hypothetical protein
VSKPVLRNIVERCKMLAPYGERSKSPSDWADLVYAAQGAEAWLAINHPNPN